MAKSSVSEVHTTQGLDFIRELGQQLRVDSIRASTTAGSITTGTIRSSPTTTT